MSLQASEVFSATQHTGGRSRATHACSRPNTLARRHILAAKPRALRNSGAPVELRRQERAPRRLAVVHKPGPFTAGYNHLKSSRRALDFGHVGAPLMLSGD